MSNSTSGTSLSQFSISAVPSLSFLLPVCEGVPSSALQGGGGSPSLGGPKPISCPPQIANFGIDTLHVTFDTLCTNGQIWTRLKEAKEQLQATGNKEAAFKFLENGSDCMSWNLQRVGSKFFQYVLSTGDIRLGLSPRVQGSAIPNMELKIGSMSCQQGLVETVKTLKFWLEIIGIQIVEEKVSRGDIAADILHDIKTGDIDRIHNYISRARKQDPHYTDRKFNGMTIGSGDILCRMYDKPLEMTVKQDTEKYVFFMTLWGVLPGTPVTRVEFQLRRAAIKEFFKGKTTIDVFINRLSDLWQYLVTEWLRHSSQEVDRENNHQSRAENSAFWNLVVSAGQQIKKALKRKRDQIHINIPALRKQATGILTSIAAALGHTGDCFFEIIDTIQKIVSDDLSLVMADPGFKDKFLTKQTRAVVSF